MNVYQKINAVMDKIAYIQKDKSVSAGGGSYRAVTHDAVTGMVRQAMKEVGIVVYPTLLKSELQAREIDKDMVQAKQRMYLATYQFDFVNIDDPADRFQVTIESTAMDNQDKAPGKALSYAFKYALLKVFMIETGEDEESRFRDYDVDEMVALISQAKDPDTAKQLYNDFAATLITWKDKGGIAAIRAAMEKRKAH